MAPVLARVPPRQRLGEWAARLGRRPAAGGSRDANRAAAIQPFKKPVISGIVVIVPTLEREKRAEAYPQPSRK
jgi:hypothetical protein